MAVINSYKLTTEEVVIPTVLSALDTALISLSKSTVIVFLNETGGALTVNVKGDTATTASCPGIGDDIDLTVGLDFTVNNGDMLKVPLNTKYQKWLGDGNVTVTGGDLLLSYLLEV